MTKLSIEGIELPMTGGKPFKSEDYRGKILVLYFYPKDNTSGCTRESQDFRDLYPQFLAKNAVVIGISRDSLKSHENFKEKESLPFELIADREEKLCSLFNVIRDKKMYGKPVRGIERSTFIFNTQGELAHEWRAVKVEEHAAAVLAQVSTMSG